MEYNYELLHKKIRSIMDEKRPDGKKRMKVEDLAEKLNVSPPRVSQVFSGKNGERFTLTQYDVIAEELGMTLGELFSLTEEKKALSVQGVCEALLKIFNSYQFRFEKITKTEKYWENDGPLHCVPVDEDLPYTAIYFPDVWEVENENDERWASYFGNISRRSIINIFLTRLSELNDMKEKGDIDQDTYNAQVEKYLKEAGPSSEEDLEALKKAFEENA